jgi:signal transduction histidine kinase
VSMRERAESLGGELTIASAPGEGTTVTLEADLDGRHSGSRR